MIKKIFITVKDDDWNKSSPNSQKKVEIETIT